MAQDSLIKNSPVTSTLEDGSLQLQDIHLPNPPDFWPPAIGWWIVLIAGGIALSWLIVTLRQKAKQKKYRRLVRAKFKVLEVKLIDEPSNKTIAEINTLLRQLAMTRYPREQIASLTGAEWLTFLDQSGKTNSFTKGAGRILIDGSYQADNLSNFNLTEFTPLIRRWVRKTLKKRGGVL